MSKKRKTRREKQIADTRRVQITSSAESPTPTYTFSSPSAKTTTSSSPVITTFSPRLYDYVITDARRTLLVVAGLLAANIGIYMLLQRGVIHFKFLGL